MSKNKLILARESLEGVVGYANPDDTDIRLFPPGVYLSGGKCLIDEQMCKTMKIAAHTGQSLIDRIRAMGYEVREDGVDAKDDDSPIRKCARCGTPLVWFYCGDGTHARELDCGKIHECPAVCGAKASKEPSSVARAIERQKKFEAASEHTSPVDDGGPAFPQNDAVVNRINNMDGMSLRQYYAGEFAAAWLPECIAQSKVDSRYPDAGKEANRMGLQQADALIAELRGAK